MQAHDASWHHGIFYPQIRVKAQIDFLMKLMYDMIRGVFPLKLLDFINQRHVQNAKIYALIDFLMKLMYDMIRGVFPLKLLDFINQRHVQNAKIYAVNHDLGFYPVKTQSSISCGKPSYLKMEKQNPSLGGGRLFKSNRNNS